MKKVKLRWKLIIYLAITLSVMIPMPKQKLMAATSAQAFSSVCAFSTDLAYTFGVSAFVATAFGAAPFALALGLSALVAEGVSRYTC